MKDQSGSFSVARRASNPAAPAVSVVMGVFNGRGVLENSVQSILGQTFRDLECVIVDDGSTDGTSVLLEEFQRQDSRLVIIRNHSNIGLTKSLIRGVALSRGRYIARQDSDDTSSPRRIETQIAWLPAYDFVCCRTLVNGIKKSPKRVSAVFFRYVMPLKNVFYHGTFLFKRSVYDAVGGYDRRFVYAQDYDFVSRLIAARVKIKYLADVLYYSSKSAGCISRRCLGRQNEYARMVRERYVINRFASSGRRECSG